MSALAIVSALEALEAGDPGYAETILLGALEDGTHVDRARCDCGQSFEWPGLRDAHLDSGSCSSTWEPWETIE